MTHRDMRRQFGIVAILAAVAISATAQDLTTKCWKYPVCPSTGKCSYTHLNCTNLNIAHVRSNLLSRAYQGLLYLKLSQNNIVSIENGTFSNVNNLRVLILSYNSIENLQPRIFIGLHKLQYLDLSHNELTVLNEESIFFSQKKLKVLLLNSNKISVLEESLFMSLRNLNRLDLSNNKLKNINENLFNFQANLEKLFINSNLISNLTMETLYPLQSLKHIDMINNSLVCNCQLEFVRRWCENQFVSAIATCHEKGDSDEKLWTNISPSKKCEIYGMSDYETMDVMLVIIGVSVTLFVMFVGLALSFCWGRASMKPIEKINFRNKYSRFMP